jgi:hypothetical protein
MVLAVAAAAVAELESIGAIDLVPGYGRDNPTMRMSDRQYPRSY